LGVKYPLSFVFSISSELYLYMQCWMSSNFSSNVK